MRPLVYSVLMVATLLSAASIPLPLHADDDTSRARRILREVDDLWRGESSHGIFSMTVVTRHYRRTMKLEAWSKGKEKTLVRILEPLKEKGTATLKSDNHLYTYLPRTDRTIRLTSGMMMGSWMGSHLTNDDLVRESRLEEDYDIRISREGPGQGRDSGEEVIEFELQPKPEAPVVWGRVMMTVLKQGYIPLREVFYDEDMQVARVFTFSEVRELGGRPRPLRMRVEPADKSGEYTEILYESLEFNIPISDGFFSLSNLKRR